MKVFSLIIITVLIFSLTVQAEVIHFRAQAFTGKITSESIDLTDWQTSLSCRYALKDKISEISRFPNTLVKKIDQNTYSVTIKSANIFEAQQNLDLHTCSYKLILIGKNKINHQTAYGEIFIIGQDQGRMNEKELDLIQNKEHFNKVVNDRLKDLVITFGPDGGIVSNNDEK